MERKQKDGKKRVITLITPVNVPPKRNVHNRMTMKGKTNVKVDWSLKTNGRREDCPAGAPLMLSAPHIPYISHPPSLGFYKNFRTIYLIYSPK